MRGMPFFMAGLLSLEPEKDYPTGMIIKVSAKDLKVGMHVIMPEKWIKHPFLRNRFDIRSRGQIRQILESGFSEVQIDTSRGMPLESIGEVAHGDGNLLPPKVWEPEKMVPVELREAIHDKSLPSRKKAQIVYRSSVQMMERLLDDPRTENIRISKCVLGEIVDLILTEENTSRQLLNITSHDFYTYTHCVNVGFLSIMLSKRLFRNSDSHDMHELGAGFFLHDLGKIKIDTAIINKPGRLTEEEMRAVKIHPYQGYLMLKDAEQLSEECRVIVLQHHEREDGTGYPRGLKGDEIHTYGRIACIADVFDALTADRSYKAKLKPFDALTIMKEEMFDHFQKEIFEQFVLLFAGDKRK